MFSYLIQMLQLSNKYDWIEKEKHQFGNRGGLYDFHENDPKEVEKRLSKLEETKEKLGRNVNARAMNLLSKEEEQVQFLFLNFQQSKYFLVNLLLKHFSTQKCYGKKE